MEFVIIISCLITIVLLKIGLNVKIKDIKKIKKIGYDKTLNDIAKKFPNNKEICQDVLKMINNKNVKIEESKDSKTSLYIALTNKIIIADIEDTFSRIQTIAHECLHSIQNRRILMFNFLFSNIFLLYFLFFTFSYFFLIYFLVATILILFNIGESLVYIEIFTMLTIIYCLVRCYLENEAMSKAAYVAKEYMQNYAKKNNIEQEDVNILFENFERLNKIGIPLTNFSIVTINIIKIIFLSIIALI